MPRSRRLLALVPTSADRSTTNRLTRSATGLLVPLALLALATSGAGAQSTGAPGTPLHLAANRFEFVASGDTLPQSKALRVHNGGTTGFTDVRLTKVTYANSPSGAEWLVSVPRQTTVAPDELATVGTLCVDATGLPAGTYRAMAGVVSREVTQPVEIAVTLVVTDAGTRARHAAARCGTAVTK